eukprot:143524_1
MGKIDIESELRAFWANLLDGDVRSIVICVVVFLVVFAGGIAIFSSSGSEQTSQSREQDLERLEYHKRLVDGSEQTSQSREQDLERLEYHKRLVDGSEQTSQSREQDLERLEYHKRLVDAIASINLEDVIPTDTTTYPHAPLTFFLPKYKSYGVTIWDLTKEFLFELRQCGAEVTDANECVSTDSVGKKLSDLGELFEDGILKFILKEDAIKFNHFRVVFAIRQKKAPSTTPPTFSKFSTWFHKDGRDIQIYKPKCDNCCNFGAKKCTVDLSGIEYRPEYVYDLCWLSTSKVDSAPSCSTSLEPLSEDLKEIEIKFEDFPKFFGESRFLLALRVGYSDLPVGHDSSKTSWPVVLDNSDMSTKKKRNADEVFAKNLKDALMRQLSSGNDTVKKIRPYFGSVHDSRLVGNFISKLREEGCLDEEWVTNETKSDLAYNSFSLLRHFIKVLDKGDDIKSVDTYPYVLAFLQDSVKDISKSKLSTNSVSHPVIIKFKVSKDLAPAVNQNKDLLVSALPSIPNGINDFIEDIDGSISWFEDRSVARKIALSEIRDIFGAGILQFFVKTPKNFAKSPSQSAPSSRLSIGQDDWTLEDMLARFRPTAKVDVTTESFTYVIPTGSEDFVVGLSDATIVKSLQKALDAIVTLVDYYQVFGIVPISFECQFGGNWYDVSIDASRKAKILGVS